jgi:hypothetical protein
MCGIGSEEYELIGKLVICVVIILIPIVFAYANANYLPKEEDDE